MQSVDRAMLYGLAAVLCWSTVATAFKIALRYLDIHQLLFYSTLTATLVLLVILVLTGRIVLLPAATNRHWRITLIAGAMNPVLYYLVLFKAYDLLPAQAAMSINYSWAIVLTVMAALILKQSMKVTDFIAAAICYLGVLVIATGGVFGMPVDISLSGVVLALLSTLIWASYWIINMRDARDPVTGLFMNFLVALPVTLILCGAFSTFTIGSNGLLSAAYIGVMEMALGFVLWSTALRLSSNASRISNLIFLSPIVSLLLIRLVLAEPIAATTLIGLAMILAGLMLQQFAHRRPIASA